MVVVLVVGTVGVVMEMRALVVVWLVEDGVVGVVEVGSKGGEAYVM